MFSKEEISRYQRHISLPEIGLEGQKKLKQAKVLVIGAGGLSSPLLLYLAAAGVGTIGIIDADYVDASNLQRQILYKSTEIGQPKVKQAKENLLAINPHIQIEVYPFRCDSTNAIAIIEKYDVIADGSDNFPTRYLVNDACFFTGKPLVYAAIHRFEGQLAVFNYTYKNGEKSSNYRDMFPSPPPPEEMPNCAEAGVLGVLPGIFGTFQALEVIKIITDIGEVLADKFFYMNTLTFQTHTFTISKDKQNPLSGEKPTIHHLIDYALFCGLAANENTDSFQEISAKELLSWIKEKRHFQLIDVRSPEEYAIDNIEGINIPLDELTEKCEDLRQGMPIVVHCQTGKRSLKAIEILRSKGIFPDLYNLTGGLAAFLKG